MLCPKLAITFADNYEPFYRISEVFPNIQTAFFQYGWRGNIGDFFKNLQLGIEYKVDYMFVFGRSSGNLYSKFLKGDIIPIGSFKNNQFKILETDHGQKVIGFISQWRRPPSSRIILEDKGVTYKDFYLAEEILLPRLKEWCFSHGYSLRILGCSIDYADEEEFFIQKFWIVGMIL